MRQHATQLALALLLVVTGCAKISIPLPDITGDILVNDNAPAPTPPAITDCDATAAVQLALLNQDLGKPVASGPISFLVTAKGCPKFRLEHLSGALPTQTFTTQASYQKSFTSGTQTETVRVVGLDSAGAVKRTFTPQVQFEVQCASTCNAYPSNPPAWVGINSEDWVDNDFNDVVLCSYGRLAPFANQVYSLAYQQIRVDVTSISACRSRVRFEVVNPDGSLAGSYVFTPKSSLSASNQTNPPFYVLLLPGQSYRASFTPLDSCVSKGTGAYYDLSRVRVGFFCNVTGN